MNDYIGFSILPIIGLAILMIGYSNKNSDTAKAFLRGAGFLLLAIGAAHIAIAGNTNALLILESARQSIDQSAFDKLHSTLDPHFYSGYFNVFLGAILIGVSVAIKGKKQ